MSPKEARIHKCCVQDKNCCGSECMAWRWYLKQVPNNGYGIRAPKYEKTSEGYCGLVQK